MARGPRRRRGSSDPATGRAEDDVDLGAPEHAWWAQQDIHGAPLPEPKETSRDVLAEHLGADWRTSFGFDRPGPVGPPREQPSEPEPVDTSDPVDTPGPVDTSDPVDRSDPYAVLGVAATATWDEIVDAHRCLARRHHPDRLAGRPPDEIDTAEQRIRDINVAYQELRVRRDK